MSIDKLSKFRPWIQKIMPEVYDDSLTYYEALSKVIAYLNQLNDQANEMIDYMDSTFQSNQTELDSMQTTVNGINSKIDSDVPVEVDNVLNDWYTQGKFASLLNSTVTSKITNLSVDVKVDYGAIGDGVADDTVAIQNAINKVITNGGGTVYFPRGYYKTTSALLVTADNVSLIGDSFKSELRPAFNGTCIQLGQPDFSSVINYPAVLGLKIVGDYGITGQFNAGITAYRCLYGKFDVNISGFNKQDTSYAMKIVGGYSANTNFFSATNHIIPHFGINKTGLILDDCVQNTVIFGGHIIGNLSDQANYHYALNINDIHSNGNLVIGTDIEDYTTGIRDNGSQNQYYRPRVENCVTKFLQDTQGYMNMVVGEWGLENKTDIVNNGGQLRILTNSYDVLSQDVTIPAPNTNSSAVLRVNGGSGSNGIIQIQKGGTSVFEVSNLPGGNDIRMFAMQADGTSHETFGFRTNGYIAKAYLKGCLTFDNALNAGDVPNGSLFLHDADGKLSFKDSTGTVTPLY